jgi:hypothetical protein
MIFIITAQAEFYNFLYYFLDVFAPLDMLDFTQVGISPQWKRKEKVVLV